MENAVEELTLLLMYLSSWHEKARPGIPPVRGCWKGFRFEVIDELEEKGLISRGRRGSESVHITGEREKLAQALKEKFGM